MLANNILLLLIEPWITNEKSVVSVAISVKLKPFGIRMEALAFSGVLNFVHSLGYFICLLGVGGSCMSAIVGVFIITYLYFQFSLGSFWVM